MAKTLLICLECGCNFYAVVTDTSEHECPNCGSVDLDLDEEVEVGDGMTDVEADADTLRSAGMGTDEDYGYYGDDKNYMVTLKTMMERLT